LMLGRTAEGLFWLFRYVERVDNVVRLLATAQRMAVTRIEASESDWASILYTVGTMEDYLVRYQQVTKPDVINWLIRDEENKSSVRSCMSLIQHNARRVRTAVTEEVWESINAGHASIHRLINRRVSESDLSLVLSESRRVMALIQGMTNATMLRNEIFHFISLGAHIERADCTLRLLDVKYYLLLPSFSKVGSVFDNFQWNAVVRSVSSLGGLKMAYGTEISAAQILDYLVLNRVMPRSVNFCIGQISQSLNYLSFRGQRQPQSLKKSNHLLNGYLSSTADKIIDYGLHEYTQKIISLTAEISDQISKDFRFYE